LAPTAFYTLDGKLDEQRVWTVKAMFKGKAPKAARAALAKVRKWGSWKLRGVQIGENGKLSWKRLNAIEDKVPSALDKKFPRKNMAYSVHAGTEPDGQGYMYVTDLRAVDGVALRPVKGKVPKWAHVFRSMFESTAEDKATKRLVIIGAKAVHPIEKRTGVIVQFAISSNFTDFLKRDPDCLSRVDRKPDNFCYTS
jgi:hypothetical protein